MNRVLLSSAIAFTLSIGCEVGEVGPPGPAGPTGSSGPAGLGAGSSPQCPEEYTLVSDMGIIVCRKGMDEIVKIGTKGSAFWIDRYEASIWERPDGTGMQYGTGATRNYPASFPANGQWTKAAYALSIAGVIPSSAATWFQAAEACRASGKRLPTNEEWQAAARGTLDPSAPNDAASGDCATKTPVAKQPYKTADRPGCSSAWGAQDMIGGLAEMTKDLVISVGDATGGPQAWPTGFNGDVNRNVIGKTVSQIGVVSEGSPAVVVRGGQGEEGTQAGLFAFDLRIGPHHDWYFVGFRCVIPR